SGGSGASTGATGASSTGTAGSPASSAAATSSAAASTSTSPSVTGAPHPAIAATLATGLNVPWGLAFLPDGSALVGSRDTFVIHRITTSGAVTAVGTVPHVVSNVDEAGEAGLLGLALHPSYPAEPWLYAYHSTASDNRIVRMRYREGRLGTPRPVLTGIAMSVHHNGGGLAFGPDGHLYVGTGDAEDTTTPQDTDSLNGKILRITETGAVPSGNPFDNEVWTYGHRNVEGLAFDGDTLWASEFGDKAYDELNRIVKGGDYGWPDVEGSDGSGGYRDPFAQWHTSACSPSGIAIADGRAWLGALQGECVWSVDLTTAAKRRYLTGHGRIRMVRAAPDGSLWVGTSNTDGRSTASSGDDRIFRVTL
ncbi:MAG: PQQ-dependent sugar dehydrogenase, partial [Nocardioides sp.]|uniref:PQQ-dependent sugar dehydrogenase n=1 Tax=Nocardioides sp. TaxID=35761 RepID=UPI0039E72619